MNKIGILGGTFNPVHNGHLRLAIEVSERIGLDKVYITPAAIPPHKSSEGILPFSLRVKLIELALQECSMQDKINVSTLENELEGASYTFHSLTEWKKRHIDALPYFILGLEDFMNLDKWYRGLELPSLSNFIVVPRSNTCEKDFHNTFRRFWKNEATLQTTETLLTYNLFGNNCIYLPLTRLDISSSYIRQLWCEQRNLEYLIPRKVLDYMKSSSEIKNYWQ